MMLAATLTMATPELKSKKGEKLRAWFDFVFGFENKKGDILGHWIAFHDNFSFPPQDFFDAIEKELAARKIPGMEISQEEFAEGGMLSDKRIYLRLFRERLALYTCAAPFGSGYFFSCRTVYVPALVRLWHIIAALVFFSIVGGLLVKPLGIMFAGIAMIALMFALAAILGNAAISDLDTLLLKIPVVATIYEDWFRADTYFRQDTRLFYLKQIPEFIRDIAEDITATKGARLEEQYQLPPILGELYKRVPPRKPKPEK
jgi:hypothetical protein